MINAYITKQVEYRSRTGSYKALQIGDSVLLSRIPKATTIVQDDGKKYITDKTSYWAILEDTAVMIDSLSFKTVD